MDPNRNEVKRRVAFHRDRRPGVMRQHEDRNVERRVIAPPALPRVVRPFAADRSEHVATENPCTDVLQPARGELIVDAGSAAVFTLHLLEAAGGDKPVMQRLTAHAERIFASLARASAESVERDAEAVNAE